MHNTKQTKRKQATCPNIRKNVQLEKFIDHVKECRKTSTEEPKIIQWDIWFRPFSKVFYMTQHKSKFHLVSETVPSAVSDALPAISKRTTELNEDWDHDPLVMLDYSDTGRFSQSKSGGVALRRIDISLLETGWHPKTAPTTSLCTRNPTPYSCFPSSPLKYTLCLSSVDISSKFFQRI